MSVLEEKIKVGEQGEAKIPVYKVYEEEVKPGLRQIASTATIQDENGNISHYEKSIFAIDDKAVREASNPEDIDTAIRKAADVEKQNHARRMMVAGRYEDLKLVSSAPLGAKFSMTDPLAMAKRGLDSMTPEQKHEFERNRLKETLEAMGEPEKRVAAMLERLDAKFAEQQAQNGNEAA